jgi:AraC-like DNA-binding protein
MGSKHPVSKIFIAGTPLQERRWLRADLLYSSIRMHPQTHRDLREARDFMRHAYGRPISLPDVASRANLSPFHFLRVYKRAYGETPHEFLTRLRIERAKTLLARGSHNVTEACFEVGFSSLGSFSNLFAYRVGLSPSEYRRYARSTISVPSTARSLFVPSCFFTMLYGTREERNFREAGRLGPMVSSGQSNETGR